VSGILIISVHCIRGAEQREQDIQDQRIAESDGEVVVVEVKGAFDALIVNSTV
jgi:hypothetical protein